MMESTTERAHAILAPSSMKRFMECPASLLDLDKKKEQPESEFAKEGTLAHAYIESALTKYKGAPRTTFIESIEDAEMAEHVNDFCMLVESVVKKIGTKKIVKFEVERRVHFSGHIFGTVDILILYIKDGKKCAYLLDFKYGRGVSVPAENNAQLLTYLVAAEKTFDFRVDKATLAIYQPRDREKEEPLDQWVVDAKAIRAFERKLKKFEATALPIIAGKATKKVKELPGSHCIFCHRKVFCKSYAKYASADGLILLQEVNTMPKLEETAEIVRSNTGSIKEVKYKQASLTDEQLATILEKADLIVKFIKAVQKHVAHRIITGVEFPGYKLVEGRKTRTWVDDKFSVISGLKDLGVDKPYEEKLLGITAIKKILGKKSDELIEPFVVYKQASAKLVVESDPRPAITNPQDLLMHMTTEDDNDDENN